MAVHQQGPGRPIERMVVVGDHFGLVRVVPVRASGGGHLPPPAVLIQNARRCVTRGLELAAMPDHGGDE